MLIGSRAQIHFCVNPTKFQVISRLNFLIENSFCPSLGKTFDDRCQDDSIGYSFDCLIMQMSIESPCFFFKFFLLLFDCCCCCCCCWQKNDEVMSGGLLCCEYFQLLRLEKEKECVVVRRTLMPAHLHIEISHLHISKRCSFQQRGAVLFVFVSSSS